MPSRFLVVEENGYTFFFKREPEYPDLLHIYVRHLTTIDDALDVFFDSTPVWNAQHHRFEGTTPTHGLYWVWLDESKKKLMVITCFRL